jgi:hypothetical protein
MGSARSTKVGSWAKAWQKDSQMSQLVLLLLAREADSPLPEACAIARKSSSSAARSPGGQESRMAVLGSDN